MRTVTSLAFFRHLSRLPAIRATPTPRGSTLSSLTIQSVIESHVSWASISVTDSPSRTVSNERERETYVVNGYGFDSIGRCRQGAAWRAKNGTFQVLPQSLRPPAAIAPFCPNEDSYDYYKSWRNLRLSVLHVKGSHLPYSTVSTRRLPVVRHVLGPGM